MSCLATLSMISTLGAATVPDQACNRSMDLAAPPAAAQLAPTAELRSAEISVLTYNIRGLPWPVVSGRAKALKEIGAELAAMRQEGRQPDVILLQEGFRRDVSDLVKTSGYRYWARGPSRSERAWDRPQDDVREFSSVRYVLSGEGMGKFTNGGLHVLSDLPIMRVQSSPYRYCAGLDCLANKGAMLVTLALPGAPVYIDVINTHLNSKGAAKVPRPRSLRAHNLQTEELITFINDRRTANTPLLVGGDFNVKNAPERYDYLAGLRPYRVVSEFCSEAANACAGQEPAGASRPWLRSQDLQAFANAGPVTVHPVKIETMFHRAENRLSDHDGYLVRYRLAWEAALAATEPAAKTVEVKPQMGTWGVKVAWRR